MSARKAKPKSTDPQPSTTTFRLMAITDTLHALATLAPYERDREMRWLLDAVSRLASDAADVIAARIERELAPVAKKPAVTKPAVKRAAARRGAALPVNGAAVLTH